MKTSIVGRKWGFSSAGWLRYRWGSPRGDARVIVAPCPSHALLLAALWLPAQHCWAATDRSPNFNIPGQPLAAALAVFATQSHHQLLFSPQLAAGHRSMPLHGRLGTEDALDQLLSGSGLRYRFIEGGVILIEPTPMTDRTVVVPAPSRQEDILVTALKRPTILTQTALSIAVLSHEAIGQRGVHDLRDVSRRVPGLLLTDTGTGQRRLTMRGIYGAGEATVGLYYDETPVTGPSGTTFDPGSSGPDLELVDVDRVEVLSGPQGTLYGASSMGGTVRVIFAKPDPTRWSGSVEGEAVVMEHGSPGGRLAGVINMPLVKDRLAARLVLYQRNSGGYIDNPRLGLDDINHARVRGGRLALSWFPAPGLTLSASAAIQRSRIADATFWYPDTGLYLNDQRVRSPFQSDTDLFNLTAHWDVGPASLVATTSYYRWAMVRSSDYSRVLDAQSNSQDGCRRYSGLAASADCDTTQLQSYAEYVGSRLPALLYQPMTVHSWTNEIRLSSTAASRPIWTIGAFLERRGDDADSMVPRIDAATGEQVVPRDLTAYRALSSTLHQKAVFGEIGYPIGALTLTTGFRYFDYFRDASGYVVIPNVITGTADSPTGHYATREKGWNFKFLASAQLDPHLLAYAQAAQGYRPGGVNLVPDLPDGLVAYKADHLWSYELGVKGQWFGGRFNVDAAAYHIDWTNMIYGVTSTNGAFSFNSNIGAAQIDGLEVQLAATPWPGLSLNGGVSFINARLSADQLNAFAYGNGRRGDPIPYVPKLSLSFGGEYRHLLSDRMEGFVRVDGVYVGRSHSQFNPDIAYYQSMGRYAQIDLRTGVSRDGWSAALFVRNLAGHVGRMRYYSNAFGLNQLYSTQPRSWGVEARISF